MRVLAPFRIALRALRRNKLRTLLTMLGIIIGVTAVISAISIGNGAKVQVEAQVASLGQNVLSVFPGSFSTGGARGGFGSRSTLTAEDAQAISREVANVVAVSCEVRDRNQVQASGLNWNTQIQGESPDYLSVRAWGLTSGAMFTDADVRSASKVCIIGKTVADELFGGMDPIGQTLRIRDIPFKILGVLQSKGVNFFGQDQDDTVVVPYTSAMRRISGRDFLSAILIQADKAEHMEPMQQEITAVLQQRRGGREPDFMVRSQLELAEAATATAKTMTALIGSVAAISLVVGGIGIALGLGLLGFQLGDLFLHGGQLGGGCRSGGGRRLFGSDLRGGFLKDPALALGFKPVLLDLELLDLSFQVRHIVLAGALFGRAVFIGDGQSPDQQRDRGSE